MILGFTTKLSGFTTEIFARCKEETAMTQAQERAHVFSTLAAGGTPGAERYDVTSCQQRNSSVLIHILWYADLDPAGVVVRSPEKAR